MILSVIIPTCNRPQTLAVCLARLTPEQQQLPAGRYEVIVSDDGSPGAARATLGRDFPWVRWVRGPQRGPAANRNAGAGVAHGEWLVFTDDDCRPDPGWLAAYEEAIQAGGSDVLEGRTYVDRPRAHPLDVSPVNETGGWLWSCNFGLRRTLFAAVGGFDERFPYNALEDTELNIRLRRHGARFRFLPQAAVLHPWRRLPDVRAHARRHRDSRLLLESLHPGAGFPVSARRAARVHARVVLTEHLPALGRHPIEMARALPALWCTMIVDVWTTWRVRAAARR